MSLEQSPSPEGRVELTDQERCRLLAKALIRAAANLKQSEQVGSCDTPADELLDIVTEPNDPVLNDFLLHGMEEMYEEARSHADAHHYLFDVVRLGGLSGPKVDEIGRRTLESDIELRLSRGVTQESVESAASLIRDFEESGHCSHEYANEMRRKVYALLQ